MRLFYTLLFILTLTLSACGGRTNAKFENLTPEQKQEYVAEQKRKYIFSLVCEQFGDEIFRYKQDKSNKEFSIVHKYFYDYPSHFNILKANVFYELRKHQVQLMLDAKGLYGIDADFKDWDAPLVTELHCDERIKEWVKLRDEWEKLQKVLPTEMYKEFTLWDRISHWLEDAIDWLTKMFYAVLAFLIISAVTIYAAALHYALLIKKNRDGLWLFLATPLAALYFQNYLKSILDLNSNFWWRLLIASLFLSFLFSCISFLAEKFIFKFSTENSNNLHKLKTSSQVIGVIHEQICIAIDSRDIARIDELLSDNTDSLKFFDINGLTPFQYLISKGKSLNESDFLIADLLISYSADVNLPTLDEREWTPLHMIAALGEDANELHEKFTKLLLENSANPDANTPTGFTPLHFIAMNGSAESMGVLNQLMKFHPNPFATTSDGVTSWRMLWQHGQEVFDALEDYEKRYF